MNPYPIGPIQIISLAGTIILFFILGVLIRRKKLNVEYALVWIFLFIMFLILSLFRGVIDIISDFLGIHYQPASLFMILIMFLFLLTFHFSIVISKMKNKLNKQIIDQALLEERIRELEGCREDSDRE
ncbi:DUF2304 domain-containing protein [Acidobacteriota bacterium]